MMLEEQLERFLPGPLRLGTAPLESIADHLDNVDKVKYVIGYDQVLAHLRYYVRGERSLIVGSPRHNYRSDLCDIFGGCEVVQTLLVVRPFD
jgi:hypothetical protein